MNVFARNRQVKVQLSQFPYSDVKREFVDTELLK